MPDPRDWLKLPGLFHRAELEQVIETDGQHEYLFVQTGHDDRGRELIAVYCRHHEPSGGSVLDIPRPHRSVPAEGTAAAAQPRALGGAA